MPTPNPSPNPIPTPPAIKTWRDVVTILFSSIVWYASLDANQALNGFVNYSKLQALGGLHLHLLGLHFTLPVITHVTFAGIHIGIAQGLVLAMQALIFIWAGPTLMTYLGPVFTSAVRIPTKFVGDIRMAWRGKSLEDKKPDPNDALTFKGALIVVAAVVLWVAASDADTALKSAVDFAKLGDARAHLHVPFLGMVVFSHLLTSIWHGLTIGLAEGVIMGVKGVVFVWVGPTFFDALGPVLGNFAKFPVNLVAALRRAWNKGAHDDPQQPDDPAKQ